MSRAEGRLIGGRYEVEERLGAGGMAQVYRAHDRLLGRDVAVKVLHPELAANPEFVERFKREAQAAAALNHPNVVAIYDWGTDEHTSYMVMEYIAGSHLAEVVRTRGPLPEAETLDIAAQVAAALEAAHGHGIVHRDVKPHNVLLDSSGQAKVADFGIARAAGTVPLTQTAAVLGTVQYLAPESVLGHPVDARADLYGLGVVLHELLSGAPPFTGESLASVAWQHVNSDPPAVRAARPEISERTAALVQRAMAKDPARRFQTAREMRAALLDARAALGPASGDVERAAAGEAEGTGAGGAGQAERVIYRRVPPAVASRAPVAGGAAAAAAPTIPLRGFTRPGAPAAAAPLSHASAEERDRPVTATVPLRRAAPPPAAATLPAPAARERQPRSAGYARLGLLLALLLLMLLGGTVALMRWGASPVVPVPSAAPGQQDVQRARATSAAPVTPQAPATAAPATPAQRPEPTTAPAAVPNVAATAAPTLAPTVAPPTVQPTQPASPAPAETSGAPSPARAVIDFYGAVAGHRFDAAAALWSPAMQAAYPPAENIDSRFAQTQRIVVNRADVVSADEAAGRATVAVDLVETTGGEARRWTGTWQVVRGAGGWLLDRPNLAPA